MNAFCQLTQKTALSRELKTFLALCFFTMLLISCGEQFIEESPVKDPGFTQNHAQGKINLRLQTSKKEITIAEQLELVLETAVPEDMTVEFPSYSASLGDFTLKDSRLDAPRMTGTGDSVFVVHRITYLLEPYLSGTYSIPAMTVTYTHKNNGSQVKKLVTEEMQVPVQSLLGPDAAAEIKDIRPPLPLPRNISLLFLVVGLTILFAGLAIAGVIYWKKTAAEKIPAAVQLRPEEIALQELDRLLAEKLLARGEIKLFHLRISDILRRYIENRFGLKAPERTTEEFLTYISIVESSENAPLGSHKALLADFLTQCDLVKFARHEPTVAESEKTVDICREFIEETKEKEVKSEE